MPAAELPPEYLASPGFTVQRAGAKLPLCAITRLDGFGRLGLMLCYSDHEGAAPLQRWAEDWGLEDQPLEIVRCWDTCIFGVVTEPLHDEADQASVAANECAFNIYKFQVEYDAMLAAGLIEPTGRNSAYQAPIVRIKDIKKWTPKAFRDDL